MGGMLSDDRPYTLDRIFRLLMSAALIAGLVLLLGYLSDVLIPFALAMLLAYLLNPLVELLQRVVKGRAAAVLTGLVLIVAAACLLMWLVLPMIAAEIAQMGKVVKELATGSPLAHKASQMLPESLWPAIQKFFALPKVKEFFDSGDVWTLGLNVAKKVLPGMWGLISQAGSLVLGLAGLVVIVLYLVFLLIDYDGIFGRWQEILPPQHRERAQGLLTDFQLAMSRYFRAQALVAFLVGVMLAVGFGLIGLPMGILLGLFIGVLNMVPYLQLVGLIPVFFMALLGGVQEGSIWLMLGLTGGVFAAVQVIQDTILVPKIMGKAMGLNPALIILSLSIWGKLLGFLGLIIAIPMTCLLWAWYQRFVCKEGEIPAS